MPGFPPALQLHQRIGHPDRTIPARATPSSCGAAAVSPVSRMRRCRDQGAPDAGQAVAAGRRYVPCMRSDPSRSPSSTTAWATCTASSTPVPHVGLRAVITSRKATSCSADAVILPGVGAFGDAMATLRRLDLVRPAAGRRRIRQAADRHLPGLQLLMTESFEFGRHEGLGIVEGPVVRFDHPTEGARNPESAADRLESDRQSRAGWRTPRRPVGGHVYMSGRRRITCTLCTRSSRTEDPGVVLSTSRYGHIEFCSSLQLGQCLCLPVPPRAKRPAGLAIYQNLARRLQRATYKRVDMSEKAQPVRPARKGRLLQALRHVEPAAGLDSRIQAHAGPAGRQVPAHRRRRASATPAATRRRRSTSTGTPREEELLRLLDEHRRNDGALRLHRARQRRQGQRLRTRTCSSTSTACTR